MRLAIRLIVSCVMIAGASQGLLAQGAPLWSVPLETLTHTRSRPPFMETRRPAAPAPDASAAPKPLETSHPSDTIPAALLGVVRSADDEGVAILRENGGERVLRLNIGDSYDGWTLVALRKAEAAFMRNGKSLVLQMQKPAGYAAEPATQASPAPAAPAVIETPFPSAPLPDFKDLR